MLVAVLRVLRLSSDFRSGPERVVDGRVGGAWVEGQVGGELEQPVPLGVFDAAARDGADRPVRAPGSEGRGWFVSLLLQPVPVRGLRFLCLFAVLVRLGGGWSARGRGQLVKVGEGGLRLDGFRGGCRFGVSLGQGDHLEDGAVGRFVDPLRPELQPDG